jgi:hypothetical protein
MIKRGILKYYVQWPKVDNMKKIIVTSITILGGWLGWWIGDHFGLMIAFLLSMICTGLGIYFGRRLVQF